jgi:site-specific DNA-methyltransferase (adenine-specific)
MAEHYGADNMALGESGYAAKCDEARGHVFEPLRAYLAGECAAAGHTVQTINAAWQKERGGNGGMAGHWLTTSQWALPTAANYAWLQALCNGHLRREYEDLRREYEDLRRYFDMRTGDQKTDVWRFSPETERHGHPTQKPVPLISYIVRLSCRSDGITLDPFMGSGTTGIACIRTGRRFVGIEKDAGYFEIAKARIIRELQQPMLIPPEQQRHEERELL